MEQGATPPGTEKLYRLSVGRHTGLLLAWMNSTRQVTGTFDQCMAEYTAAQRHNLLFGWWSLFSFWLLNPITLLANMRGANKLKKIAARAR